MRRQKSRDRKKVRTKKLGEEREWGGGGSGTAQAAAPAERRGEAPQDRQARFG